MKNLYREFDFKKAEIHNSLDRSKTYGYYVTTNTAGTMFYQKFAGKRIQSHGRHFLRDNHIYLERKDVAIHTGFCEYCYDSNDWQFYESHFDTKGVKLKDTIHFISDNKLISDKSTVHFFEDEFDFEKANELVDTQYGTIDILRMGLYDYLHNFGIKDCGRWLVKPDSGLICSEYYAICQSGQDIIKMFRSEPYVIAPAYVQAYSILTSKEIIQK